MRPPPRHLQTHRRGADPHLHPWLPRRGAALDRRGGAAGDHLPPARLGPRQPDHRRGRRGRPRGPRRRGAGLARRGARCVLRHPGPAEIPQERPHRGRARRNRGAPPRHGRPRHGVPAGARGPRRVRPAGPGARPPRRLAAGGGGGGDDAAGARDPRRDGAQRLSVRARLVAHDRRRAELGGERPSGGRSGAADRRARGLSRRDHAWAACGGGAVARPAARGTRRERASGQDRVAVPRWRGRALPGDRRPWPRPGRRRHARPRAGGRGRGAAGSPLGLVASRAWRHQGTALARVRFPRRLAVGNAGRRNARC